MKHNISVTNQEILAQKNLILVIRDDLIGKITLCQTVTIIREAAVLAECPGFGKTIFEYSQKSYSASDFQSLADDFPEGRVMYGRE